MINRIAHALLTLTIAALVGAAAYGAALVYTAGLAKKLAECWDEATQPYSLEDCSELEAALRRGPLGDRGLFMAREFYDERLAAQDPR